MHKNRFIMNLLQIIPIPIVNSGGAAEPEHLTKLLLSIFILGVIGVIIASIIAFIKTLRFEYTYINKWEYFKQCLEQSGIFFFSTVLVAVPVIIGIGALIYNIL